MQTKGTSPNGAPGSLRYPGDDDFDRWCTSWNARVRHQPEAAIGATNADEVAAAVAYAVANDKRVRMQATGHGAQRPATDGVLINTTPMRRVTVDPDTRTANVQAGTKWVDVVAAAHDHGLAPLCGSSTDIGAVGFCLGGGTGWLVRPYGLAADTMAAAQIVTADGRLRWVDDDHEPDLFWALHGGGPNLGAVTELRIGLMPVSEVYGGNLVWPVEHAGAVLRAWRDWLPTVPTELTSVVGILHAPDAPFVPEPLRGKSIVRIMVCHAGDPELGARLVAPLRRVNGFIMDQFGSMPFTRIDDLSQDPVDPLPHSLWSAIFTDLTDATIEHLARIAPRDAEPYAILELRHIGGGVRPPADRAGLAHWSGNFLCYTISITPEPAAISAADEMAARFDSLFAGASTGLAPLNFLGERQPVGQAYTDAHLARLNEIKRAYDPDGVFGGDRMVPGWARSAQP
jgi:FAD/FMN-containing dehydrogenase